MRNAAETNYDWRSAVFQELHQLRRRLPVIFLQEEKSGYMIVRRPIGVGVPEIAADGIESELRRIGIRMNRVLKRRQAVLRAKWIDDCAGSVTVYRRLHPSEVVRVNRDERDSRQFVKHAR